MITRNLSAAAGAFETMRVYRGTPFAWRRHAERLGAAASALGLAPPDPTNLRDAVGAVLQANGFVDARVRVTLVGAPGGRDSDIIVAASALTALQPTASVVSASWPRNERAATAGVKSISYADNIRAFADARARGADEAIFANTRGELCEATGSNVFVVDRETVRTPPEGAGCLLGITRALVLELCTAHGIPAAETDLPLRAITDADEAFLTSTTREVQAIAAVDGRPRATTPGPVTIRLASMFAELVTQNLDP